ncbi:MAG: L-aspartate oxidase [Firmicutes bacterium]|nr:L-aspartate oxidase [Bacillota bacterium]
MGDEPTQVVCPALGGLMAEAQECRTGLLVIGSGVAGLYAALKAASHGEDVLLLTKGDLTLSNTYYAQGGIAAAICHMDSKELHIEDTLAAGAGLCALDAVTVTVSEGVDRVLDLVNLGVDFDREGGSLALTREGAHRRRRVLHARGDATGREIALTLINLVRHEPRITVVEQCRAVDLVLSQDGRCTGAIAYDLSGGQALRIQASAVLLASGGVGQVYKHTTNPASATGDGIAMAVRAGARVADMEFHQFHPTALYKPGFRPSFLISEAARGEGALLLNSRGERFMPRYHELAELAPRDVVSRAIVSETTRLGDDCVYLDLRGRRKEDLAKRFPTIYYTLAEHGFDITRDLIPVAPAAHYMMGGVATDLDGRTDVPGLYACGEVACAGVHGANRLASNSLLEALVFAWRAVKAHIEGQEWRPLSDDLDLLKSALELEVEVGQGGEARVPGQGGPGQGGQEPGGLGQDRSGRTVAGAQVQAAPVPNPQEITDMVARMRTTMWKAVGITRSEHGLRQALSDLDDMPRLIGDCSGSSGGLVDRLELRDMLLVSKLMARAALERTESRGSHFRQDHPQSSRSWQRHILLKGVMTDR